MKKRQVRPQQMPVHFLLHIGDDAREPGVSGGAPLGGGRPTPRRNERCAEYLGAMPALPRRHGRQPAGLGARHGDNPR